jgi:hypothetical protein
MLTVDDGTDVDSVEVATFSDVIDSVLDLVTPADEMLSG